MKCTIISDTHLGDPECTLFDKNADGSIKDGANLGKLLDIMGKDNDCLILLGDIMDFAINDYEDVYQYSYRFFKSIKEAKAVKRIVYIPGNHDYNIWHTIEHQSNVINQINNGKPARKFKMSVPFIMDDRKDAINKYTLAGVTRKDQDDSVEAYGGMFLDNLIPDNKPGTPDYIPFLVAFPNLYLFTEEKTILMTHGQYLETYWSALSLLYKVLTAKKDSFNIKDFIAVNFPLCELGSIGIGQAGPLTDFALEIEKAVTDGKYAPIKNSIKNIVPYIIKELKIAKLFGLTSWILKKILTNITIKSLKKMRNSDYISDLTINKDEGCIDRFNDYITSSRLEIEQLQRDGRIKNVSGIPDTFLFGHTHVPVVSNDNKSYLFDNKRITLLNSGGWLTANKSSIASGPVVFVYETGKDIKSIKI
ncbi:MAG: metallophosphoesterase [Spirochaetota bacterium]